MGGIYIPGMEMPKSCDVCRFAIDGFCYASGKVNVSAVEDRQVTNYCPLIPVPEHGRLIDADAMTKCLADLLRFPSNLVNGQWIVNTIREQPTIIPADKEGEG